MFSRDNKANEDTVSKIQESMEGYYGRKDNEATPGSIGVQTENPGRKGQLGRNIAENGRIGYDGADGRRAGGVDPTFGAAPYRIWAKAGLVSPKAGSVVYQEQQTAVSYGVPSFVVSDDIWEKAGRKAPAFSVKGQIYFGETLDQKKAGKYAPHEVTHVMKQVGFKPYLDFIERTPGMLNMSSPTTQAILQQVGSHRKVDIATMTADQARDLFDEFNATVYNTLIKK